MLADVWVVEVIKVLVEVFVIAVRDDVVIDTVTIGVDSDIGVEVLADVNANVSVVMMTALLSTPLVLQKPKSRLVYTSVFPTIRSRSVNSSRSPKR